MTNLTSGHKISPHATFKKCVGVKGGSRGDNRAMPPPPPPQTSKLLCDTASGLVSLISSNRLSPPPPQTAGWIRPWLVSARGQSVVECPTSHRLCLACFVPRSDVGGGASRSREAAGEGRRNHQRGTGQISAKTGESVATRPRRRTRRLQCDVSGATLTEIEGPGTSSGAYGRGGGGGREGGTGRGTRGKEVSPPVTGRGDGRGAVTLPTRPPPGIATIFFYRLGSILFPPSPSAVFFPRREPAGRWCLSKPGGCWGGEA